MQSLSAGLVYALIVSGHPSAAPVPVRELRLEDGPSHLAARGGTLYVSGFHSGGVSAVDRLTGKTRDRLLLDAYELPADPEAGRFAREAHPCSGGSLALAGDRLFAGQSPGEWLLALDPATMRVVKRLPLGGGGQLAATPDGALVVYASDRANEFHLIDPATYRHTTVAYPRGGRGIGAVAVSPDGRSVVFAIQRGWTPPDGPIEPPADPDGLQRPLRAARRDEGRSHLTGKSFLAVYDLRERRYTATVNLAEPNPPEQLREDVSDSGSPFALAFSGDGKTVYAGMFQSLAGVRAVDTEDWFIRADIRVAPNRRTSNWEWTNPDKLAVYRHLLFAVVRENCEVLVVDTRTDRPVARLRFPYPVGTGNLAVAADRVYVGVGRSVYELDGWALARRLAARPGGDRGPGLDLLMRAE